MNRNRLVVLGLGLCAAVTAGLAAGGALGPPLLCDSIRVPEGARLPWSAEGGGRAAAVPAQLTEFLGKERNPLVRLEAIRRAAVGIASAKGDAAESAAWRALGPMIASALEREIDGQDNARTLVEAGFFIATLRQAGTPLGAETGTAEGAPGYGFVRAGLAKARQNPALKGDLPPLEFGALLMSHPFVKHDRPGGAERARDYAIYDEHLAGARAGADSDALLRHNLADFEARFGAYIEKQRPAKSAASKAGVP